MLAKSSSGRKHLWRHLDRCTSFKSKEKQMLLQSTSTLATPSNWVFSQQKSHEILTKLIIADERPFKSVDHPPFKAFVASLQPKFKAHGRITLKSNVMEMHQLMKNKIEEEIKTVDKISLTTDLWTSLNQTPFMVVSAHFISPDSSLSKSFHLLTQALRLPISSAL
jgi:hypothetical protein